MEANSMIRYDDSSLPRRQRELLNLLDSFGYVPALATLSERLGRTETQVRNGLLILHRKGFLHWREIPIESAVGA
jgi:hypothetical protein